MSRRPFDTRVSAAACRETVVVAWRGAWVEALLMYVTGQRAKVRVAGRHVWLPLDQVIIPAGCWPLTTREVCDDVA